jgi:hypothetical protein
MSANSVNGLSFTTDGVENCGAWRVNQGRYNENYKLPGCPRPADKSPHTFTFYHNSTLPVKLYYLQECDWRPTNHPMIPPNDKMIFAYVYLTTNGLYQVRNSCAELIGMFQVTRDNEQVYWPPPAESPSIIPEKEAGCILI